MTDTRIRALIVGGDSRNLTDALLEWVNPIHISTDSGQKKVDTPIEVTAVVVITRWVSHSMFTKAREFAKKRGVPLVQAHTGNYILSELVRFKILGEDALQDRKKKHAPAPEPKVEAPPPAPVPEPIHEPTVTEQTGLTPEEVWELYGSKAIEIVKTALKPGDKVHEDDLMHLFEVADGGVGLPKESAIHLLPELAVLGLIQNTKGKTWQIPNTDVEFDYKTGEISESEEQLPDDSEVQPVLADKIVEKVKKGRKDRAESKLQWVELLGGINAGPYPTQRAIWDEALEHEEFSKPDGQPLVSDYYWTIIPIAIEYGVVERLKDGSYVVVPDDKVKLTRRGKSDPVVPDAEPIKHVEKKPEVKKQEPKKEPDKAKPKATKSGNPAVIVRSHYGGDIPVLDRCTAPTKTLKRMIPARYWDEAGARTVARIIGVKDFNQCMEVKEVFDNSEWDRLAFDTMRALPIETIIPFLKELPQDYDLTCVECAAKFLFTVSEQEFIKKMVDKGEFESFEIPKRCAECRKKARASRL
jgi:hypothetical protein